MQQEYVVRTTFIRVVIKVKWVFKMSTSDNKKNATGTVQPIVNEGCKTNYYFHK